ncbi:YfiR family protein [Arenimonas composti]|uniref:YfiR family protein n=1 Tax=Arenimonas composti TaxID=370776 RepID=UPI001378C476|nr:YfiR family protein [Arenimonas composti]
MSWPRRIAATLLAFGLLLPLPRPTAAEPTDVASVQAAYLVNFVRYTRWPQAAPAQPLQVVVVGRGEAARAVRDAARRIGAIDGRPLRVRTLALSPLAPRRGLAVPALASELATADVVFVPDSHASWHDAVVEVTDGRPVLTVSAGRGFVTAGGMFELFEERAHVHFAANQRVIAQAPLQVSARLMSLARPLPETGS